MKEHGVATRTETYEERAFRLALEATDPASTPVRRNERRVMLTEFVSVFPPRARARISEMAELLGQAAG